MRKVLFLRTLFWILFLTAVSFAAGPVGGGSGGTSDHSALTNLDWTSSGHTGTANKIAGFDGSGVATEYDLGSGSGDVLGPSSSVDNNVVFFSGTSGKLIKDSGLTLSGTNTGDQDLSSYYNSLADLQTAVSNDFHNLGGTDADTTYTAGTGLTLSAGAFNVNTSQNIAILSNLTTNGFIKTSNGTGTLSVDTNTYLTSESDPVVGAISGMVKADGVGNISAAVSGTDYTNIGNTVEESELSLSDVTTANASISAHGFCPKLSNNSSQFLNGTGAWSSPSGSGDVLGPASNTDGYIPVWNGADSKTLADGIANNSANWNTAYSWGDHSVQNYFDKDTDTLDNVPDGTTYKLVTAAEKTVLGNTSGTNTGDETQSTIKTKLGAASSGVDGYLTGTDWNTFNNKVGTETDPVVGAVSGIVKADGAGNISAITGSAGLAGVLSDETGSGAAVFGTGPTLAPRVTISDSATTAPLSVTARSAAPSSPVAGDIYLDDGTNTASTNPGWRRYTGTAWEDVSAGSGGGTVATGAEIDTGTDNTKFASPLALKDSHNVPSVAPGTAGNKLQSNGTDWISASQTGTTFPTSPATGDLFLHTPTGRKILYQYDGTAWQPIQSYGSMTIYVDGTNGTDDISHGTGTGTAAFATIQYAIDTIPGTVGGDVAINIAAGTYYETVTINGKTLVGDFNIRIKGSMSSDIIQSNADIYSEYTIGDSSLSETVDAHAGKILRITGGTGQSDAIGEDVRRIIKSNTATTFTIVGQFPTTPDATTDFIVEDWETIISGASAGSPTTAIRPNGILVNKGQKGVIIENIKVMYTASGPTAAGFFVGDGAKLNILSGWGYSNDRAIFCTQGANLFVDGFKGEAPITANGIILIGDNAAATIYSPALYGSASTMVGLSVLRGGVALLWYGGIFDSFSTGINVLTNGAIQFVSNNTSNSTISNNSTGIKCTKGGQVSVVTTNITFTGNTTDVNADATSFGYIG